MDKETQLKKVFVRQVPALGFWCRNDSKFVSDWLYATHYTEAEMESSAPLYPNERWASITLEVESRHPAQQYIDKDKHLGHIKTYIQIECAALASANSEARADAVVRAVRAGIEAKRSILTVRSVVKGVTEGDEEILWDEMKKLDAAIEAAVTT